MAHDAILPEIERFLADTGMGASYFGEKAVGNSKLVPRLRLGRSIQTDTVARVNGFMADERARRRDEAERFLKAAAASEARP